MQKLWPGSLSNKFVTTFYWLSLTTLISACSQNTPSSLGEHEKSLPNSPSSSVNQEEWLSSNTCPAGQLMIGRKYEPSGSGGYSFIRCAMPKTISGSPLKVEPGNWTPWGFFKDGYDLKCPEGAVRTGQQLGTGQFRAYCAPLSSAAGKVVVNIGNMSGILNYLNYSFTCPNGEMLKHEYLRNTGNSNYSIQFVCGRLQVQGAKPETPSNFRGTSGYNSVNFSWSPVPSAVKYQLNRLGTGVVAETHQTTFLLQGLSPGITSRYNVVAVDEFGVPSDKSAFLWIGPYN